MNKLYARSVWCPKVLTGLMTLGLTASVAAPALADFGWGESASFPLDLHGVHRGRGDSASFVFCAQPCLIDIAGGWGPDPAAFISPRSKHAGYDAVDIRLSEVVTLDASASCSAGGVPPDVVGLTPRGEPGAYRLELSGPIAVGQWTNVFLTVSDATGVQGDVCLQIANLPDDCNQDGQVNLNDATKFGSEFNGPQTLELADLNGDGQVNLNDATLFGQIWNGTSGEGMNPDGTGGWQGQGLPVKPPCSCP